MKKSFLAKPTQLERNLEGDREAWRELTDHDGYNPSSSPSSCTHILHYKLQAGLNGRKPETLPPIQTEIWLLYGGSKSKKLCFSHEDHSDFSRVHLPSPLALPDLIGACDEPQRAAAFAHRQKPRAKPSSPLHTAAALLHTHTQHFHTTVFPYVITLLLNNSRSGFSYKCFDLQWFSVPLVTQTKDTPGRKRWSPMMSSHGLMWSLPHRHLYRCESKKMAVVCRTCSPCILVADNCAAHPSLYPKAIPLPFFYSQWRNNRTEDSWLLIPFQLFASS